MRLRRECTSGGEGLFVRFSRRKVEGSEERGCGGEVYLPWVLFLLI